MAGKTYKCDGCGIEVNAEIDNVYPQGKENYCRSCNKKFPSYLEKRASIWNKYDKLKWDETKQMRKDIFGTQKPVEVEVEDDKEDIKSRLGK